jgi:hypothetical protein
MGTGLEVKVLRVGRNREPEATARGDAVERRQTRRREAMWGRSPRRPVAPNESEPLSKPDRPGERPSGSAQDPTRPVVRFHSGRVHHRPARNKTKRTKRPLEVGQAFRPSGLADVVARTDTLGVAYSRCDRVGRYPVATLILTAWPDVRHDGCAQASFSHSNRSLVVVGWPFMSGNVAEIVTRPGP